MLVHSGAKPWTVVFNTACSAALVDVLLSCNSLPCLLFLRSRAGIGCIGFEESTVMTDWSGKMANANFVVLTLGMQVWKAAVSPASNTCAAPGQHHHVCIGHFAIPISQSSGFAEFYQLEALR